jgi:8-oxo-dGTP pyrophosphatase MutT (NUDIX family)
MKDDFNVLWQGEYASVISPVNQPYEALHHEEDGVMVLPLNLDTLQVRIRSELCPPYGVKEQDPQVSRWFTPISGGIEPGESIEDAVLREVREEAGLIFTNPDRYALIPLTPKSIPFTKAVTQRTTAFLLAYMEGAYEEEEPQGDGTSYEELSKTIEVGFEDGEIEGILTLANCDFLLHAMVGKAKAVLNGLIDHTDY